MIVISYNVKLYMPHQSCTTQGWCFACWCSSFAWSVCFRKFILVVPWLPSAMSWRYSRSPIQRDHQFCIGWGRTSPVKDLETWQAKIWRRTGNGNLCRNGGVDLYIGFLSRMDGHRSQTADTLRCNDIWCARACLALLLQWLGSKN